MVSGKYKSGSLRKVFKKTPGSRNVIHYTKRKSNPARCSETGQILPGVPCGRPSKIRALPKSKKRPERPFGGVLSSQAMRKKIIEKARSE